MIVTVTCNPAIDITYRVDRLQPGEVHRVRDVATRPGGKGVNVARVLHQLGEQTTATGLADAFFGVTLEALGVPAVFVPALAGVRRTLVVHADSAPATTSLWEPGAAPADPTAAAVLLIEQVTALLTDASALVVSGSLPPGVDPALPAGLATVATAAGIPAVLDLDDAALRVAADGGGAVLVPNRDELARLSGAAGDLDVVAAARDLSARSRAPVVATLGADGMLAVAGRDCWHARPAEHVAGNPTGAGDAAAAAIARGLAHRNPWPDVLADAVALSSACVLAPVAGEVDLDYYQRVRPMITATPTDSLS
ncbi:MAG TPA: hexose kinase [Nocardioidaceae bacterium]|nr:hexose kinase [Nocardioidaceae bacterium]